MTLVWLGILVLAFSWLRALPVFYDVASSTRWVVIGTVLLVIGLRNKAFWQDGVRKRLAASVLVCSILAMAWLDGPFRVGFLLLAIASLLSVLPIPRALRSWTLPGLWVAGMVYVVQAACVPLLYVFSARYHQTAHLPFLHDMLPGYPAFPWLASLLYMPLKLMAPGTALGGSTLYLVTALDTQALTPTWEKLGLIPMTLFVAGAVLILLLRPDWRKRLPGLILWVAVFAYIRLLILFLLVNQFRNERVFWSLDLLFYGLLALPFLLGGWWYVGTPKPTVGPAGPGAISRRGVWARVLSGLKGRDNPRYFSRDFRTVRVAIATCLVVGGLVAFWGFHDPGTPKQGRILIDEGHSDWEWTTQPYDTVWYGGKSGYNYYCLADYWNYFYHVETRRDSLTPDFLSQWDVLVIKTPTSSYAPEEIDAIDDFVRRGGGLFLIGDHTNVFGTSTHLNPIAERFGMYFRYDATYNLRDLGLSLFERPRRFAHPVVRFMPNYLFATSCTLYSPLLSENVILGYGLRAMYLDYSENSYFPTKKEKMDYDFGLFVQAGGVKYGKGRVLGYTDSTCFSNFFMFIPGKPELALASIGWLNRTNRWARMNPLFLLASLVGLVLLVTEARRNSAMSLWTVVITAGTSTLIVLGLVVEWSVTRSYALPQPHRSPVHVTFDQSHGNYVLPAARLPVTNWQNFQTFYVWTQRLGLIPRNEDFVAGAVDNSRVLVEIQPVRHFSIDDIDLIVDFVRHGGTLVVLDSPENTGSTAGTLLGPFNIRFDDEAADSIAVLDEAGDTLGVCRKAYAVRDVVPMLRLSDGRIAMGYRSFEEGRIVVCGASYVFSSVLMGNTAVVPDDKQRRIFQAEYDLFGKIAGLEVTGRYQMQRSPAGSEVPIGR